MKAVVYVHGRSGRADEARRYEPFFKDRDVIGFDYKSQTPWDAKDEFASFFGGLYKKYDSVTLIANSIGAFFSMSALSGHPIEKAFFISPVVDMEKLIRDIMAFSNVTEDELREKREIPTSFGETLSWDYFSYVRENSIVWSVPTEILYGEKDNLVSYETVSAFAKKVGAGLTVMDGGEHWFHTDEQMAFLDNWLKNRI
ncbi:MAG: alpha/beta hydrolase [Clostridia bacterium]|nr:alpha/beta hydrolase [Clostridia bacterium]